jgi:hypothetical protein
MENTMARFFLALMFLAGIAAIGLGLLRGADVDAIGGLMLIAMCAAADDGLRLLAKIERNLRREKA